MRTIDEEADLGLLPGIDAERFYVGHYDPCSSFVSGAEQNEPCSYLRETYEGIECGRHPEAVLRDSPRLWSVVSMWRSGVQRELSRADYASLTNFEIECWLTLCAAHNRETERRIKQKREEVREHD